MAATGHRNLCKGSPLRLHMETLLGKMIQLDLS